MSTESRPYEPTSVDKAQAHAKKTERKHMRPQNWRNWLEDEEDDVVTPETEDKDANSNAS